MSGGSAHRHEHDHPGVSDGHAHEHTAGGWRSLAERLGLGHSHDPSERIDTAMESSGRGIRAVKLSLLGLGVTAALQLVVVFVSGSVALLADTVHNLSDALTALPLWMAFSLGRRAATRRYTYGYGRAEDLAGIFIIVMIALSAGIAGWEAIQRLLHPEPVRHLGWVAAAGILGLIGNEAVAIFRIREGRRIGSAALVADGYHARTDGFTSLAVVLGAAGVFLGFPLADPLVGLAIAVVILFVLRSAVVQMFERLMDAVDPDLVIAAERALAAAPEIEGVSEVRVRWVGHRLWAEALVTVDCERSLPEAHAIAERARHDVLHTVPRLAQIAVHVDPCEHDGAVHHAETAHHFPELASSAQSSRG